MYQEAVYLVLTYETEKYRVYRPIVSATFELEHLNSSCLKPRSLALLCNVKCRHCCGQETWFIDGL